jgi:hypothetical protein
MQGGWVKLWRKILGNELLKHPKLLNLWIYCLVKASHKEHTVIINQQSVLLKPGQFIFGRKAAAKEIALSEQEIRTRLNLLKRVGNLTIKSTNKYSIITVINWDRYQGDNDEINQQINQQVTSSQPQTRRVKKGKKKEICPFQEIVDQYNDTLGDVLPMVRKVSPKRQRLMLARWNEKVTSRGGTPSNTLEFWKGYFHHVRGIPFLLGENKRGWVADFDWLMKQEKFLKVIEGSFRRGGK